MDYGRALARTFGASLHLLHVAENPFLRPTAADPHALKAATLRRLAGRLTDDDKDALHATAVLETSDDPADAIVKYAGAHGIDLIVMGTHGRGVVAQILVGSVAEKHGERVAFVILAALVESGGHEIESVAVAGLIVWRVFTVGVPVLMGVVAVGTWRRGLKGRPEPA